MGAGSLAGLPSSPGSRRARIQLQSPMWLVVVGLQLALQLVMPSRVWVILLAAMGGALLVDWLWARTLAGGIRLVRERRFGWSQVGDRLQERITLLYDGWAPLLWLEVQDHSDLPGYRVSRVFGPGFLANLQWTTEGSCSRRRMFTLGPAEAHSGDPFGLFKVTLSLPEQTALLVLPPILLLPEIQVGAGGRAGEGRQRQPKAFERTVQASGVQSHLPGDPLARVHWPTTARRGEMFVRQLDATPSSDWWLVLDLDAAVQAGQGDDTTEEVIILLAAALAERGRAESHRVGLAAAGSELIWLPPAAGSEQRWMILRALALAEPGDQKLMDVLESAGPTITRGSMVLITPNVTGDWLPFLARVHRPAAVTVLLLDPRSFHPAAPGLEESLAQVNQMGIQAYPITSALLDLPVPPAGQDMAAYFLFDLQKGYCDYFATAIVVLARAAGLPARLTVGYASGSYDPIQARFTVTEADAHAWPEIFFPRVGWVPFEPTSGRVSLQRQGEAAQRAAAVNTTAPANTSTLPPILVSLNALPWFAVLLTGLGVIVMGWIWFSFDFWWLSRCSSEDAIEAIYRRLLNSGRKLKIDMKRTNTPIENCSMLCTRLEEVVPPCRRIQIARVGIELDRFLVHYHQLLYSQRQVEPKDKDQTIEAWRRIRRACWFARWYQFARRKSYGI